DTVAHIAEGVRRGLREASYIEGQNVTIEYRWANGHYDRLPALAAELVQRHVTVITAGGNVAAQAAKAATTVIPIVFTSGADPVWSGLPSLSLRLLGGSMCQKLDLADAIFGAGR